MTRTGSPQDRWRNTDKLRCPKCRSTRLYKDGFVRKVQRYRCKQCGAVTIAPRRAGKK